MNPETLRQLLNHVPDESRPWWLNGIITGLAITVDPTAQDYLINQVINPILSADEAVALEAVSMVLTEAPFIDQPNRGG